MNDISKNFILWLVIAVMLFLLLQALGSSNSGLKEVDYTTFMREVASQRVVDANIDDRQIQFNTRSGESFQTFIPGNEDPQLIDTLLAGNVTVFGEPPHKRSIWVSLLLNWFPFLLLIGVWVFFMRQMQGGGGRGAMSFGKSKAKMLTPDQIKTTFADVAGCDEAKEDVKELVDYLKEPARFQELGGKIPKGILMVGPPGTGKTLLARAIAGEAKVPFFAISGSDFVEMFVGVGAARVRDMFEQAKKSAPCIIFIDEIDAVGRHRGSGHGGGNDEREQTLNQMLVEMDGFEDNKGIIIIAATNRPDVLDKALLRPGRFDREVNVSLPDVKGREQILKVHLRKIRLAADVDAKTIARGTPGYSGAELANLVNEAALFAARKRKKIVTMEEFELAKDKINLGAERRSLTMTEQEKEMTAYHEAGHAIIGSLVPGYWDLHKVTIVPRGRALGVAHFLPEGDDTSHTKEFYQSQISVMFGGRAAEEIIYGKDKVTSGASSDIQYATSIARSMVTQWGLSEKVGPILTLEQNSFSGQPQKVATLSPELSKLIDDEIKYFIDTNYDRAVDLLNENIDVLHAMKDALMLYETLNASQVKELIARKPVTPVDGWDDNDTPSGDSTKEYTMPESKNDTDNQASDDKPVTPKDNPSDTSQ
ncbi:ATP-dependent zinc metalloprotease FtsH [Thorsellia anophelis]|uniref:ATP-dependent zinc metalloprotease FtsH n=1 Tax=Thorsellia anophelis DSM 18579 TaxID=1123402 RepID=A0A1I0CUW0_9GAMM|nr:ATP-dependent zinc metalloprotease FtsH [Thorsellia anophelis]SET23510.1 cell division protease FtsH [Thorsellia anophelis DSM 18579]